MTSLLTGSALAAVRPPAAGSAAMVVSAHAAATAVGVRVLQDGGNAFDAAVAVGFALSVCEPQSSGVGGGGFLVAHVAAESRQVAFDYRETAPGSATRDMFLKDGRPDDTLSRDTGAAVATPGLVAGLRLVHTRHGRLPWARVVLPAARLAEKGCVVDVTTATAIVQSEKRLSEAARALLLPGGVPLAAGQTLVQPALGRTLRAVARDGGESFYRGATAARLARTVQAASGILRESDLAAYRPVVREPLRGHFQGYDVVTMPPPSAGGVQLLQMLQVLEHFPLAAWGYGAAAGIHVMVEAMRASFADRARYLGDPDFVPIPLEELLRPTAMADRARHIDPERATPCPADLPAPPARHTTHYTIVDGDGNAVAATHSTNLHFGAGILCPETGVFLNNEMDDFGAALGHPNAFGLPGAAPNAVAPRKRPLSSMTPTLVLRDGNVALTAGSPGGSTIVTTTLQVIVNALVFGMDVAEAVAAPRFHHQGQPCVLRTEPRGLSPDTRALLRARGHDVDERPPYGNAMAIARDPRTGRLTGAADPRGAGTAHGF